MILELSYVLYFILLGYWCLSRIHTKKLSIFKRPNYAIFYESLVLGFGLFVVASLVGVLKKFTMFGCNFHQVVTFENCGKLKSGPYPWMFETLYAAFLAVVTVGYSNQVGFRDALEQSAKESGLIPTLILESIPKRNLIELTTRSRKVYVG